MNVMNQEHFSLQSYWDTDLHRNEGALWLKVPDMEDILKGSRGKQVCAE